MKIEELRNSIEKMRLVKQKVIANQLYFIRNEFEYLVIQRDYLGISTVRNEIGKWTNEEKESACIIYYETDASKF